MLLVVEDSDADFLIVELAVKESSVSVDLRRVTDGAQALRFLRQLDEYQNEPQPDLVLLNWNLPKRTGYEVLVEMRTAESLRSIPVVVFTSSARERDTALALGARDFVVKPSTLEGVIRAVQTICSHLAAA